MHIDETRAPNVDVYGLALACLGWALANAVDIVWVAISGMKEVAVAGQTEMDICGLTAISLSAGEWGESDRGEMGNVSRVAVGKDVNESATDDEVGKTV